MMIIGSSIELNQLKNTFRKPKKLILGLILQIFLFPLFAFLISGISNLSPEYKLGLIILAACPGGTLSNFISYLIKADTPLSIGLTSTNSLFILITIPIYISLGFLIFLKEPVSVITPVAHILTTVFLLVIIPVLIGSYFRHMHPRETTNSQKLFKIIASVLLGVFFLIKIIGSEQIGGIGLSKDLILTILPWALLLNIVGLFLGFGISKTFRLSVKTATTMGIEVGLQNTVLALLITDVVLLQPVLGHPALIYALFSFWTTLLFGIILFKENKPSLQNI